MPEDTALREIQDMSAYALAELADCGKPLHQGSDGAKFLRGVRDEFVDVAIDCRREGDAESVRDASRNAAYEAIDIWPMGMWGQFVDLAAFQETPDDGSEWSGQSLDDICREVLIQIGERLFSALAQQWLDSIEKEADDSEI